MPVVYGDQQEQFPPTPQQQLTVAVSDKPSADAVQPAFSSYRPATGSYLDALNTLGNTEQAVQQKPSYGFRLENEPAQQDQQQQQTVVSPDFSTLQAVQSERSSYRPTMGSYLDALNKEGNLEQPSPPPSFGYEMKNELSKSP